MAKVTEEELQTLKLKLEAGIKLTRDEKKTLKENDKEALAKKKSLSFRERLASVAGDDAQLMGDNDADKYAIRELICTGNYILNAQISGEPRLGGLPSGRIWQLAGINSCGKTFLMLETMKNAQKKYGYFLVIFDTEMANNDKKDLKKRGIDTENLLYIPCPTVEEMTTKVLNLLDEISPDDRVIIGIDSIGNISTKKEIAEAEDGSDTKDMTRAAKLKAFFRTVTVKAGKLNVPMIAINHVYDNIGGGGKVIGGGSGSLYNASIINEFTKAQVKKTVGGKEIVIAGRVTSTATKCRLAKEKTKVGFNIDFEEGLTLYSGLLEFCLEEKLLVVDKQSVKFDTKLVPCMEEKKDERYSKQALTPEFWENFLDVFLEDYMRRKFKYQSVSEEVFSEEEIAEFEQAQSE